MKKRISPKEQLDLSIKKSEYYKLRFYDNQESKSNWWIGLLFWSFIGIGPFFLYDTHYYFTEKNAMLSGASFGGLVGMYSVIDSVFSKTVIKINLYEMRVFQGIWILGKTQKCLLDDITSIDVIKQNIGTVKHLWETVIVIATNDNRIAFGSQLSNKENLRNELERLWRAKKKEKAKLGVEIDLSKHLL